MSQKGKGKSLGEIMWWEYEKRNRKKLKKESVSPTLGAIIPVGVVNDDPLPTALAASLDFILLDLLKYMLFQWTSPSFFDTRKTPLRREEIKSSI